MAGDFPSLRDRILSDLHEWAPVHATFLGLHEYDDRLPDARADSIAAQARGMRAYLGELDALEGLGREEEEERTLLRHMLASELLDIEELGEWRRNPCGYPLVCLYGLYLLAAREFAPAAERARSFLSRLRQVPSVLGAGIDNVEAPPRVFCQTARMQAQSGVLFLQEAVPYFSQAAPGLSAAIAEAAERAEAAFRRFDSHLAVLAERPGDAPFAIGEKHFVDKLRLDHMITTPPAELVQIGREEIARAEERLTELASELAPGSDWPEIVSRLAEDHPAPEGLLDAYRAEMDRARRFVIENDLASIPRGESLAVVPTPQFDRPTVPYAAYLAPGPFEKQQVGLFYVTPVEASSPDAAERLAGHPRAGIPITAVHEGYPGHHLQLTRATAAGGPVHKHFSDSVTAEGWALYCEQMTAEAGFLRAAESEILLQKDILWRAVRILVDVGLHCDRMSLEEAVDTLVRVARLQRPHAEAEVRRYTMTPTQPLSYIIGKRTLLALREDYKRARGGAFSLKRFHDEVLSCGTVPQAMIRRRLLGGSSPG